MLSNNGSPYIAKDRHIFPRQAIEPLLPKNRPGVRRVDVSLDGIELETGMHLSKGARLIKRMQVKPVHRKTNSTAMIFLRSSVPWAALGG